MKTERRHELQTNTLANSLGEGIGKVRPYTNHILLAIGAIVVLLLALTFYRSQAHAKQAKAWEAYFVATTPSESSSKSEQELLRDVVKDFGDTKMADWAKLTIGDDSLNNAAQLIATNKSDARKNINAAIAEYRPLGESSEIPQVRNLANYNLGICYEMLGDSDKAIESYRKVNGTLGKLAQARVEALEKNPEVRDFYEWFADAKTAAPDISGGSQPGRMPPFKVDEPKVTPFSDVPGGDVGESDTSPIKLFPEDAEKNKSANPGEVKLPGLGIESPEEPTSTSPDLTLPATTPPATPEEAETSQPKAGEAPAEKPAAAEPEAAAGEAKPAEATKPVEEAKPVEPAPAEQSESEKTAPPAPAKSE
jgi:tetratricopeptide (TPR) repeat protein